ncbi:MAG: hypothetical protein FJ313_04050 [Gemmatimonadetes bacterium]|nr:hypothetical protein [Gemmatimonadota bacterium]
MHVSQFAGELRCPHCGGRHGTRQWPTNGDLVPFYFQKEPGAHTLEVRCPHCGLSWHVVWDSPPGPVMLLDGVATPRAVPQAAGPTRAPTRSNRRLLVGFVIFSVCIVALFAATWTDGSGCAGEVGADLTACRLRWVGLVAGICVVGGAVFGTIWLTRRRRHRG